VLNIHLAVLYHEGGGGGTYF